MRVLAYVGARRWQFNNPLDLTQMFSEYDDPEKLESLVRGWATSFPNDIVMLVDEGDIVDHKELLRKYIEHVSLSEGTTFLGDHDRDEWPDSVVFTDAEWAELQKIGEET